MTRTTDPQTEPQVPFGPFRGRAESLELMTEEFRRLRRIHASRLRRWFPPRPLLVQRS